MRTEHMRKGYVRGNQSGQSAVEFLFMVPFLIMIVTMSAQYYLVHRAKFEAAVEHRNVAVNRAVAYNAQSGREPGSFHVSPVEKEVKIVIGSRAFPKGLKVRSSESDYLVYGGTGRR